MTKENERSIPKPLKTLKEMMSRPYSFRQDKVAKMFHKALQYGLELPPCKRPQDSVRVNEPNYCPYHRVSGHVIEDCYVFKNWVEDRYQEKLIRISPGYLQTLAPHSPWRITKCGSLVNISKQKSRGIMLCH